MIRIGYSQKMIFAGFCLSMLRSPRGNKNCDLNSFRTYNLNERELMWGIEGKDIQCSSRIALGNRIWTNNAGVKFLRSHYMVHKQVLSGTFREVLAPPTPPID